MPFEYQSEGRILYTFFPNDTGFAQFRVRARKDALLALSPVASETTPMYDIIIGGWKNSKSAIRKNGNKPNLDEASTPEILHEDETRGFWVRWENGTISVGREGEATPFLKYTDEQKVPIKFFGVSTGWRVPGHWIIEEPRDRRSK